MKTNMYNQFQRTQSAKEKYDFYKAEYEKERKALVALMIAEKVDKLTYKTGKCTLVKATDSVTVDTEKVKAMFEDWKERFSKPYHRDACLRW